MSHTPHEIAAEFPEHHDAIHRLKTEDARFRHLFDDYHTVNRSIHRAETLVEPMADETLEELKKRRLRLKDDIARYLA